MQISPGKATHSNNVSLISIRSASLKPLQWYNNEPLLIFDIYSTNFIKIKAFLTWYFNPVPSFCQIYGTNSTELLYYIQHHKFF